MSKPKRGFERIIRLEGTYVGRYYVIKYEKGARYTPGVYHVRCACASPVRTVKACNLIAAYKSGKNTACGCIANGRKRKTEKPPPPPVLQDVRAGKAPLTYTRKRRCTECDAPIADQEHVRATVCMPTNGLTNRANRTHCAIQRDMKNMNKYRKTIAYTTTKEHREAVKAVRLANITKRKCIGVLCQGEKEFDSTGAHHRICEKCHSAISGVRQKKTHNVTVYDSNNYADKDNADAYYRDRPMLI